MKKIKEKAWVWHVLLAVAVLVFSACGGAKQPSSVRTPLVIWDYWDTNSSNLTTYLIETFNNSQSDFTASRSYIPFGDMVRQLTLAISSGDVPDLTIFNHGDMASFIAMGLYGDVTDITKDVKWDEYLPGPLEATMENGKHYGLPMFSNCTALFYNKDMFDAAGLAYPDENTTWEDFRRMAKTLTGNGVIGFGNSAINNEEGMFQCLQWAVTAGGYYNNLVDGVEAFEFMADMIREGIWAKESINWAQSDVNNNFIAGNLAMQQNGPWQIPWIKENAPNLKYGVTVLPKFNGSSKQAASILGGEAMGVVKKPDMSGAVAFLKFYDRNDIMIEAAKLNGSFPVKAAATRDPYWNNDPLYAAFALQLSSSVPQGPSPKWHTYSISIQTAFQEAMTLVKTPQQVVSDAQRAIDAIK
jgi:multiple sugar transport system substrate-binding protein